MLPIYSFLHFYFIRLETKVWKEESICRKRGIIVYFTDNRIQTDYVWRVPRAMQFYTTQVFPFCFYYGHGKSIFCPFSVPVFKYFLTFLIYFLINWISTAYVILNSLCLITDYTGAVPEPTHLCGLNKSLNHSPAAQGRNCGDRFWFCRMLVDL